MKASAVQLGVAAVKGALAQANVESTQIEEVYFGNVLQANVGQSPARQVVIGAGLPEETEATTINKVSFLGPTRWGPEREIRAHSTTRVNSSPFCELVFFAACHNG